MIIRQAERSNIQHNSNSRIYFAMAVGRAIFASHVDHNSRHCFQQLLCQLRSGPRTIPQRLCQRNVSGDLIGSDLLFDSPGFDTRLSSGTDSVLSFSVSVESNVSLGSHVVTLSKPTGNVSSGLQIIDGGSWQAFSVPSTGSPVTVLLDGRVLVTGLSSPPGTINPTDLSWTETARMNVPRTGAQSILLPDGRVMVFGGSTGGGQTSSSVEIFDPAANLWTLAGFVRNRTAPVLLPSGKVLLLPDEIYDPSTQTSASVEGPAGIGLPPNVSGVRIFAGALRDDGTILVTGPAYNSSQGCGTSASVCSVMVAAIYDPATDSSRTVLPLISSAINGSGTPMVLPDGGIFVRVPYRGTNQPHQKHFFYDPKTDRWQELSITNLGSALVLPTGKVLLFGPADIGDGRTFTFIPEAWTFDPATGGVAPAATPTFSSLGSSVLLDDGRILVGPTSPAIYSPESCDLSCAHREQRFCV